MSSALINHLWQSTLFTLAIALLTLALRGNGARTRHCLWLAASCKFLIPFSIVVSLLPHPAAPPIPAASTTAAATIAREIAQPFTFGALAQSADTETGPAAAVVRSGTGAAHRRAGQALTWLWACGSAVVLASWMRRWLRVRATVRSARPLQIEVLESPIPVKTSAAPLEPGLFGILHPVLFLPDGILAVLTPAEVRAILAHELCHLRRRDNLTGAIHMLVEAVFWFHPFVWWIGARLIDERERACDEAVVESGNDPQVYAEGILKVCKFYVASPVACVAGISGADLKRRIDTIMTRPTAFDLNLAKKSLLASAFALIAFGAYEGTGNSARAAADAPSGIDLVLRNGSSWDRHPDFEDVLGQLGMKFEVKRSSDIAKTELSRYGFIVIPGGQFGTGLYVDLAHDHDEFERYVRDGGTLVVEMNGAEQVGMTLPGGVNIVSHAALDNLVTLPDHPILTPLRGKPRITAVFASQGYLMDVPAGALVLAAELLPGQVTANLSRPTFVEYSFGKGRVIAAAQRFHDLDYSGRGPLMATLLKYAAARDWFPVALAPADTIAAPPPMPPKIDPGVFDRYVGHYQYGGNRIVTVSRSGDQFSVRGALQGPTRIYPKSEREYFAKTVDAQLTFVTDGDGQATRLIWRQGGRDINLPRMDDALAQALQEALEQRFHDKVPAPGSESRLREFMTEAAAGKVDYARMDPLAAHDVRAHMDSLQDELSKLGAVQSIQFKQVEADGSDAYDVIYAHGSLRWRILLNADGAVLNLAGSDPVPDSAAARKGATS
jgi:beta-lactamase regulating signal transducer with metallopeptidase domain